MAAVAAVAGLTVALAQQPVRGAFNGSTSTISNQATTASTFCTTPSSATVTADEDSFVDQGAASSVSGGTATFLSVTARTDDAHRAFVGFPMPTVPSRCTVTGATLRLYAETEVAGRTLGAYRADPTAPDWTEAGLTWSNQPLHVGTPVTAVMPNSDQYVEWTVTSLVRDLYTAGDNGFVVRDQDESGFGAGQQFNSRSVATNKPQLYVAWG